MRSQLLAFLFALGASHAAAGPEHEVLARSDGSVIDYYVDMPDGPPDGLLLVVQGSGCQPVLDNPNMTAIRNGFPTYATLVVDKVGVTLAAGIVDGVADCPAAFHASYTISQRVADLAAVLGHVRATAGIPGRLVLFGGSEGGIAVAMLAAGLHPDATVILSSATGTSFGEMVLGTVRPEGRPTVAAAFAAARAAPESGEMFAGFAYRFWADILDRRTLDYLMQTSTPFLLIQGGRDTSSPLAAARATADAFGDAGLCNLTYFELPALDHGMAAPDGTSLLASVVALAAQWAENPIAAC